MGSLIWVVTLWGMRLAAGAAVLATMTAAVAMYKQAEVARERLDRAVAQQKAGQSEMWRGL